MPKPLSVAVVAACPFPSHQGTQILVRHLAEAQVRAGYQVELISYGYGESLESFSFTHHRARSLNAGLRSGPNVRRALNDCALGVTTQKVLQSKRCDVLHVHNVEGLLVGAALKASGEKTPLIYHAHNTMKEELPTYYQGSVSKALMALAGTTFDHVLPRYADAVIVFDSFHRELHIERGVSPEKIFVVAPSLNGAELRNEPAQITELPEGRYLVYAGNPDGYQNLELLWQSFARIRQALPDTRLLILSRARPEDFGPTALKMLEGQEAIFRYYANRAELASYLRRAEVGLSTRVVPTGFPVKLINYRQLGLRAVACEKSVRGTVAEGIWLAKDDPDSYAATLLEAMVARPQDLSSLPAFEIDASIPAYTDVYETVLERARTTSGHS